MNSSGGLYDAPTASLKKTLDSGDHDDELLWKWNQAKNVHHAFKFGFHLEEEGVPHKVSYFVSSLLHLVMVPLVSGFYYLQVIIIIFIPQFLLIAI